MEICHECAIKVRFAFPKKKLVDNSEMIYSGECNVCNKRRAYKMYELTDKEVDGDVGEATKL